MRPHLKRIIAVLACIAIIAVMAIPISADYVKDYQGYMRYAIGTSGITLTANGVSNYEYYSEEFCGGGMVSNSTYFPTVAKRTETANYIVTSENLDENYTEVTIQYNNNSWGYVTVPHTITPKKYLDALTFNRTYVLEGKYNDIFNETIGIDYFIPKSMYKDANSRNMFKNACTVQLTINCLDGNGAKVNLSHTENNTVYGTNGGFVSNTSVITDAITALETKLAERSEQNNTDYMVNQRCRLVFAITDVITNYDMHDSIPDGSIIQWDTYYPVTSTNGAFTPNPSTIPYNVIDNTVDMNTDFTQWIGTAISGIWSFELLPNISIGAILIAILSTCIVIAFLKFFAGG